MINEHRCWIVNKGEKDFERTDMALKKHIILKPFIPQEFPLRIALEYTHFKNISIVNDIEKYVKDRKLKQLIIRDAGIGDLLLLEPILRQLSINGKRDISILSRFPEVFENNPYLVNNFRQIDRDVIPPEVDMKAFDTYEDLRHYSETCAERDKKHRTDCYNQKFNIDIEDIEPRLYFQKEEKSTLVKQAGKTYIGICCDGSHCYRRYEKGEQLIDYILNQNPNAVVIVLGTWNMINAPKNKHVVDLQEKTTVREAINIVRDLDYLISVDTGLMHVALCMHVPTVCIMSIIKPELRLHYYKGQYQVYTKPGLTCIGCGGWHMAQCSHGDKDKNPGFIAPCLDIAPKEIYDKLLTLKLAEKNRIFINEGKQEIKQAINIPAMPSIIKHGSKKLTMPIIVLDEEKNLPRFIELVMKHPAIGRVIAIDGGSNDKTVELLKMAGAMVYIHHYDRNYHDMQAMQRNYSCSFVKDGEKIIIMDIDECYSKELSDYLYELAESNIVYGRISRRTFKMYADINDKTKQIKDYPDYQPRFYTWDRKFKWVGSPHHNIYNVPNPVKINKDIIHFEAEGKNREALEAEWSKMNKKTKVIYG